LFTPFLWQIEAEKQEEEERALCTDLLASEIVNSNLPRQRMLYTRERNRRKAELKKKRLTGAQWATKIDGASGFPFFYNEETGEGRWDKPLVIVELELMVVAQEGGWGRLKNALVLEVMQFLRPAERILLGVVCKSWRACSIDEAFMLKVTPVEGGKKGKGKNFKSLSAALKVAQRGDVVELGIGHHWEKDGLVIPDGIMIEGDEVSCDKVVLELGGTLVWRAKAGGFVGVTIRRPRREDEARGGEGMLVSIEDGGVCEMSKCMLDSGFLDFGKGVLVVKGGGDMLLEECVVKGSEKGHGVVVMSGGVCDIGNCTIVGNKLGGVATEQGGDCRVAETSTVQVSVA